MRNPDRETVFKFKQFAVTNHRSAMKVGTDGVLLGAWVNPVPTNMPATEANGTKHIEERLSIIDVGCGTGLIALMLAQRFPKAEIVGVEIDEASATEAEANVAASTWTDRISILHGDINDENLIADRKFDLIVSNPPFFTNGITAPDLSREQARHESSLSLNQLLSLSAAHLLPEGKLALILPAEREVELASAAAQFGLCITRLCRVSTVPTKPPRRVLAELQLSADPLPPSIELLAISDSRGSFTAPYIALTKDFYLKF